MEKYEDLSNRLDEIIKLLEKNEVGLEESIELYKEAVDLIKKLNDKLTTANEILVSYK